MRKISVSMMMILLPILGCAPVRTAGYAGNADHTGSHVGVDRALHWGTLPMHAHNDYEHDSPLFEAVEAGASSVEADIYLVNGQVLVAHELDETTPERTLASLYIDPLVELISSGWGGDSSRKHLYLFIDFKQQSLPLFEAVLEELEPLKQELSVYRNGSVRTGSVTVVLTGNAPRDVVTKMPLRWVFIDGKLSDLQSNPDAGLVPVVSSDWRQTFGQTLPEPGSGEERHLQQLVLAAHNQGRLIRFWGAPDHIEAWKYQSSIGIDLINTDHPSEFNTVFRYLLR